MPSARVSALTRDEITAAAKRLRASRPAKWTVLVEGRELPARPLILEAAGVPPNDPTNSHQAIAILENLGFETRYAAEPRKSEQPLRAEAPADVPIEKRSILEIIAEATKELTEEDWKGFPTDFSKNVDHYLYGTKREEE